MRINGTCPEKKESKVWIFNIFKLIHIKSYLVTLGTFSDKQLFSLTASKVGQEHVFGSVDIL